MQKINSKTFTADMHNIASLIDFVSEYARAKGMVPERISEMQVVLEEAFVNICRYAYSGGRGEVEVNCFSESDRAVIELIDTGVPFDLTTQELPKITGDIHERKIGGLGCLLIRSLIDRVAYRREKGKNILSLTSLLQ